MEFSETDLKVEATLEELWKEGLELACEEDCPILKRIHHYLKKVKERKSTNVSSGLEVGKV